MFSFDFHYSLPGQVLPAIEEVVASGGLTWGKLDQLRFLPVIIDGSARDAGNTSYTDVLRPGLILGRVRSGSDVNKYMQWDPAATDGSNKVGGILMYAQKMQYMGSNADRFAGYVLFGGPVRAASLQIASSTSAGISGATSEWLLRRQLHPFFQLDDDPMGYVPGSTTRSVTADLTITEAMAGTEFHAAGAGAVNFTLPATAKAGLEYRFYNTVDQNMTITAGTADTMIVYNDIAADSVALSTSSEKIGGSFRVVGNGSKWLVIPMLWEGQTPTIATWS